MSKAEFVTDSFQKNVYFLHLVRDVLHIDNLETSTSEGLFYVEIEGVFSQEQCGITAEHAGVDFADYED